MREEFIKLKLLYLKLLIYNKICTASPFILLIFVVGLLSSCDHSYAPKPMGYFRIDLPPKEYKVFDSAYPYSFSYPVYSKIIPKTDSLSEPYWMNIFYPQFKGTLYLSYKPLHNNLPEYLEDARNMVMKHIPKANSIEEKVIQIPTSKVYGIFYDIRGNNAASPFQFFVTDSIHHFLRGSLYFYTTPNNDSLEPVIDFLKQDIETLVSSLQWKNIKTDNLIKIKGSQK